MFLSVNSLGIVCVLGGQRGLLTKRGYCRFLCSPSGPRYFKVTGTILSSGNFLTSVSLLQHHLLVQDGWALTFSSNK